MTPEEIEARLAKQRADDPASISAPLSKSWPYGIAILIMGIGAKLGGILGIVVGLAVGLTVARLLTRPPKTTDPGG